MTRTYIRKNGGTAPTESAIKEALLQKHSRGISFRKAAQQGISKSTLHRLSKQFDPTDPNTSTLKQNFHNRQVLTPEQEEELSEYLIVAQKLNHGLTPLDTKKLAYCYGKANQISMPNQWSVKKAAGSDWFSLFLKRSKNLSIRKPERTSQARAAAVNHRVIDKFYDDLFELITKHNFQPEDIFNCDETNNPTVVEPQKIVAKTGVKAVSTTTSQEQGTNVTMLAFVNAAGKHFPGVFVFPRVKVNLEKMNNLPEGFIPLAHKTGWMTAELFLISLQHLHKQINCSPQKPVLLIMDNHISHISYPVVEFSKKNGIILFTLPPHTSHVTQPLDKCLFGPMKQDLKQEHHDWIMQHPGQRISIYDVPGLTIQPYKKRFNSRNIKSAFAACGIYPFNRHAIPEHMFAPSEVTDLPAVVPVDLVEINPVCQKTNAQEQFCSAIVSHLNTTLPAKLPQQNASTNLTPSSQGESPCVECGTTTNYMLTVSSCGKVVSVTPISNTTNEKGCQHVSPDNFQHMTGRHVTPAEVIPHPQVPQTGPRVSRFKNRGSSRVLTSTPEMIRVKESYREKMEKENRVALRKNGNVPKNNSKKTKSLELSNPNSSNMNSTSNQQVTTKTNRRDVDLLDYIPKIGSNIVVAQRAPSTRKVNRKLITEFV